MFRSCSVRDLTSRLDATWFSRHRWYGDKGRALEGVELVDALRLDGVGVGSSDSCTFLALLRPRFADGTVSTYQALLEFPGGADVEAGVDSAAVLSTVRDLDPRAGGEKAWLALVRLLREGADLAGASGVFRFVAIGDPMEEPRVVRSLGADQSNTSVVVDESFVYKAYRRVEPGIQPEIEILAHLARAGSTAAVPRARGYVEYLAASGERFGLGVLQDYVASARDAWTVLISALGTCPRNPSGVPRTGSSHSFSRSPRRQEPAESAGSRSSQGDSDRLLAEASAVDLVATLPARLALSTVALHAGLATLERSTESAAALGEEIASLAARVARDLGDRAPVDVAGGTAKLVDRLLADVHEWPAIRTHGDFHLGQVLVRGDELYIVDFEGEPARGIVERRRPRSPLRDVAGMTRSFDYAGTFAGVAEFAARARATYIETYLGEMDRRGLGDCLPEPAFAAEVLALFELEKALYEVIYELRHRPEYLHLPLGAVEAMLRRST